MPITMTVSEARATWAELLDHVLQGDEVTLTRHGRPVAVVVHPDLLRVRRADDAVATAERLRRRMEEARRRPLSPGMVITADWADEHVAEIQAGRDTD